MKRFRTSVFLASCLSLFAAGVLSSCNTIEGAGEDIESVGEAIQDGADG